MHNDKIEEKLSTLPENPGVYLMKNSNGKIIYVGKAVILKNRERQYFRKNEKTLWSLPICVVCKRND